MASAQVAHFAEVYEQLRKLDDTGTETPKDLANAKADLVQAELQPAKDIFDEGAPTRSPATVTARAISANR